MKLSMAFVPAAALLLLSIPATRTTIYSGYAYAALQMGLSTNPEVLIGKKQWLFENTERDLQEYRGTVKVDAEAVVHWKRIYLERMAFARDVGADFVFVITPLKQTANAEFLPTSWRRTGEETRIKQLEAAVRESGLDVLDVTDALIARRRLGEQIWYKYDTHLNWVGALATAETIVNHLHEKHPEIPPLDRSKYDIRPDGNRLRFGLHPLNLADKLGIRFLREPDFLVEKAGGWTTTEKVLPSGWMTIYSYTKNDPALPTLVMYGDSNIFPMRRFIAEHFRHSTFVNPWEAQDWAKSQFPPDFIATERPNIVLNMRAESGLLGAAANPPELRRIDASPH